MKQIMDTLTEILTVAIVMLTQGAMIAALTLLAAILVFPENPLVVQCLRYLKGLL